MNVHDYLNSFTNFEQHLQKVKSYEFDLNRITELLNLLDNPQNDLKIIHVAGTKGKGSTCAFLTHILSGAGFKVGLYTSPHLHRVNERIRVLNSSNINKYEDFAGMITDDQLASVINDIRPQIASMLNRGLFLTYFEVLTVIAFCFFKKQELDFVILETGLGGRLDATNAAESMIAVLTPISLDHTKILGGSLTAIAQEKAGIIKSSRQRVVIAPQPLKVMEVLLKRCQEFGIPPIAVSDDETLSLEVSLKGVHQQKNALTALKVIELLKQWQYKISDEAIVYGLKHTRWEGRFEILRKSPVMIADGAHNHAAALALAKTVVDEYAGRNIILVLGLSADKDIQGIAAELKPIADTIILTKADHPRAYAFSRDEAKELFSPRKWYMTENVNDAIELALSKAKRDDVIVITGSLFIAAQARAYVPA